MHALRTGVDDVSVSQKCITVAFAESLIFPSYPRIHNDGNRRTGGIMKRTTHTTPARYPLLFATAILLAGCASTGMERSNDATTTMQTVDNDIKRISAQLDATGKSLDKLMMPGQPDVKEAFNAFSEDVVSIEKMEQSFSAHADEMQARGKDYFEEWQKEGDTYTNPSIQQLSDQRRSDLGTVYGRIATNSVGVKTAFHKYVSDVKEIHTYLSTDLTAKGIEAIAPISRNVVRDGEDLKYNINSVQTAIETARKEMAHNGTN
jgi:hypothetical protein